MPNNDMHTIGNFDHDKDDNENEYNAKMNMIDGDENGCC